MMSAQTLCYPPFVPIANFGVFMVLLPFRTRMIIA